MKNPFWRWPRIWDGLFAIADGLRYLLGRGRRRSTYRKPQPVHLELFLLEKRELMTNGILEYAIPTGSSGPRGIAPETASSTTMWFTEGATNKVAKIDSSNNFTEYSVTTSNSNPWDIVAGPDGNMWFTEAATDKIAKITTSGTITEYTLATAGSAPHGITSGPDGNLWFTESGRGYVGKITTSGTITEYNVGGQPENIVSGPDGNLWFTDLSGNKVAKITTSGTVTSYTVPTGSSQPYGIAAGADGNLWFTEFATDKVGKVTTSGTFTEYTLTGGSTPRDIAAGYDTTESYLIFAEPGTNKIGRITTGGTITEWSGLTASSAPEGVAERAGGAFLFTENSGNKIGKAIWTASGSQLVSDPQQGTFVPYGSYEISPQTGDLRAWIPLDLQTTQDVFGSSPSLVYVSSTANAKPILQATYYTNDGSAVPSQLDLQLTWNNGSPQSWVTFTTTGHSAGDTYLVAAQVSSAVTTAGLYPWKLEVKGTYSGGNVFSRVTSGTIYVAVNGSSSPFGYGWNLSGVDKLVSVTGGMVWDSATGGARFFSGSGPYTSPANDFGTLVKNGDNTFTYTDKFQYKWDFDTTGTLTKQTDPHGLLRTFTYSGGRISTVTEPNGAVGTFAYNGSNKLATVTAPGNRVYTITVDGSGDLTGVTNPDGGLGTFTYNGSHQLTNHKLGLINTTFAYDATGGGIATITLDERGADTDANLKNAPANAVPMATTPAKNQSDGGIGVATDARSFATTYLFDAVGRITELRTPDGATQTFLLDTAGLATVVIDGRGNRVTTTFNGSGDATRIDYANGAKATYTYDGTYHKVTVYEDPRNDGFFVNIRTTYTYSGSNGDLQTVKDALGNVTTNTYVSGRLESVTEPRGKITTYLYNARRLETVVAPDLTRTTYLYDSAGNQTATIDALLNQTTSAYDGMRHPTTITYANGSVATYLYNANGVVTDQTDSSSLRSTFAYSQRVQLTSSTEAAGQAFALTSSRYYDAAGNLTGVTDTANNLTAFLYDALNRQTVVVDPTGFRTTTFYDLAGNVTGTRDGNANLTQFLLDTVNLMTATVDGVTNRTSFLRDIAGFVTGTRDQNNNLWEHVVDVLGRQTVTIDPLSSNNRSTMLYDAAGYLTGSLDANGNLTQFLYDGLGRQTVVIDALNNRTSTLFDSAGNATVTIDPLGNRTTFLFDALNRNTVTINPLGNRTTTLFDSLNRVTGSLDPRGNLTQYLYDGFNRQTVVIDALTNRTTSLFDSAGRVSGMLDQRGKLTQFLFDSAGRTTVSIDPLGNRTTTLFDSAGNATVTIDPLGNRTTFLFDANNRATVTIDALGNRTTSLFDAAGHVTGVQDARGNLSTYLYDAAGWQTVAFNQLGFGTTTTYDAVGNVSTVIDANNHYTTFLYDALNRRTVTIDAANYRTTLVFGNSGLVSMSYDQRGSITTFLYDAAGRQTVVIDALSNRTTSLRDAAGNVTVVIDARDNRTTFLFDALNRQTVTIDARDNRVTSLLDAAGNITGMQDARGNLTQYVYDDAGRMSVTIDALSNRTTTLFDGGGNATVTIDSLANRTTFLFDALNRSTVTIDALTYRTTKMFDAVGNLTALKDGSNNLTTFGYDAANRKIRATDPLGGITTLIYDNAGLLTRTWNRLIDRHDYEYSARNELTTDGWYDTFGSLLEQSGFTYDPVGNLTNYAYNLQGTYTFLYDALNRVTSVTELGKVLTFAYDAVGNRTKMQTEIGITTSTYDGVNNLTKQEFAASGYPTLRVDFAYNASNQLENETRYSDLAGSTKVAYSTYLYDALNRITSQYDRKGSDNSVLASYAYLYDSASRITSQTINGATNTFAYDTTNQLTGDGTTNVTYDNTGNRNNGSYTTGTGNRMTNDGTYTYTYDAEGNMTKKSKGASAETWNFTYGNKNRLVRVEKHTTDGGTLEMRATYSYDVFDNRTRKQVDTDGDGDIDTDQKYWYDGWKTGSPQPYVGTENYDVWADSDGDNAIQTVYLRGDKIDQLVARYGSGSTNVRWTLLDRQNSVRNVLNDVGTNKDVIGYDGYGKISSETDSTERGRYAWTGREIDTETGLQYNRARYYDPVTARWITEDPWGFDAGDSNLYRYVNNRPTMATDPSGLFGDDDDNAQPNILKVIQDSKSCVDGRPQPQKVQTGLYSLMRHGSKEREAAEAELHAQVSMYVQKQKQKAKTEIKVVETFQTPMESAPVANGASNICLKGCHGGNKMFGPGPKGVAGDQIRDFADSLLQPLYMFDDLVKSGEVLVVVTFGGEPYTPDYTSNVAKKTGEHNAWEVFVEAELDHLKDAGIQIATFGAVKGGGKIIGLVRPPVTRSNGKLVQDIADAAYARQLNRVARKEAGFTTRISNSVEGMHAGGEMHNYAKQLLDRYQKRFGDRGLQAEVRYFSGKPLTSGKTPKGSVRLDVVEGDLDNPIRIYDYKFGEKGIDRAWIDERIRVGGFRRDVVIIEVRPLQPQRIMNP